MSLRVCIFMLFFLVISVIDARTLKIPDYLLLCCLLILVILDIYELRGIMFFLERLTSAIIWFIIYYFIFLFKGGLGFGDVKFAFLTGYALGLERTPMAFISTAAGAVVIYAAGIGIFGWKETDKVPFAPIMCAGALAAIFIKSAA